MKLSHILELALVLYYGEHWSKHQFLCNALDEMLRKGELNKSQHKSAIRFIEGLMHQIYPDEQMYCMVDALHRAKYLPSSMHLDHMAYTTELYVWVIFDLKNKGL